MQYFRITRNGIERQVTDHMWKRMTKDNKSEPDGTRGGGWSLIEGSEVFKNLGGGHVGTVNTNSVVEKPITSFFPPEINKTPPATPPVETTTPPPVETVNTSAAVPVSDGEQTTAEESKGMPTEADNAIGSNDRVAETEKPEKPKAATKKTPAKSAKK